MNNNFGTMSFFDMFEENKEIKAFNEEQTNIVAEKNNKSETEAKKTETKKEVKASTKKAPVDPNKEIEKKCAECEKIVVKVFGHQVFTLEDETEIKAIKLENILSRLIEEGFDEFSTIKAKWNVSISEDKKTGFLIPTYDNFFAKG